MEASWPVGAIAPELAISKEMIAAGVATLAGEYNFAFDPTENDAEHFVTRLFLSMWRARNQYLDRTSEAPGSRP